MELFAHHAGRKSVMVDDVLLAGMLQTNLVICLN